MSLDLLDWVFGGSIGFVAGLVVAVSYNQLLMDVTSIFVVLVTFSFFIRLGYRPYEKVKSQEEKEQ